MLRRLPEGIKGLLCLPDTDDFPRPADTGCIPGPGTVDSEGDYIRAGVEIREPCRHKRIAP